MKTTLILKWRETGGPYAIEVPAFVGRSAACQLCLDVPELPTATIELSQRQGGVHLLALRGPVLVDGQPVERAVVAVGQRWTLAPGLCLEVLEVSVIGTGDEETARKDPVAVRYEVAPARILCRSHLGSCRVEGVPALVLEHLLRAERRSAPWEELARDCLPTWRGLEGLRGRDRERARAGVDQNLSLLRRNLAALGLPETMVYTEGGVVYLYWRTALDRVTYMND